MDIHRCRFVPYPPSAINALAFSHPSPKSRKEHASPDLRLAIGRENGNIEIWKPQDGDWFQETTLWGGKDRTIDGLTWICEPDEVERNGQKVSGKLRLFSIGHSTVVTEWDLVEGIPLRQSGGNHGEFWCLAAQPRGASTGTVNGFVEGQIERQDLALGCIDGSVITLSTADDDLTYLRTLARPTSKKAQVLSITFKDRNTIVTGCADSKIRIYNVNDGTLLRSMSLGAGPKTGSKDRLVWSIKCLSDGTIVSGDATGEIRFWDGKTYTLMQRLRSHVADVFEVEVSPDGEFVFSGAMDRRTVIYKKGGSDGSQNRRWAEVSHRRYHTHDVKAFAVFDSKNLSVLVSGGLDATPIVMPLKQFGIDHHRALPSLPQQPPVLASSDRNLLVTFFDREVRIWRINKMDVREFQMDDHDTRHKLVARIGVLGDENITSVSISPKGNLLAVATSANIKLFRLRLSDLTSTVLVRKLKIPLELTSTGARSVTISPNCRWLAVVSRSSKIRAYRIVEDSTGFKVLEKGFLLRRLPRHSVSYRHGQLASYDRTVTQLAFSADGRLLVACDLAGFMDSWALEGQDDLDEEVTFSNNGSSFDSDSDDESSSDDERKASKLILLGQSWIRNPSASLLPRLPSACVTLSFRPSLPGLLALTNGSPVLHPTRRNPHPHSHDLPSGEDRLLVVTSNHQIFEFSIMSGSLSLWSRRNPPSTFPTKFLDLRDLSKGCVWDIQDGKQRVWLYGISWLWMFDLAQDFSVSVNGSTSAGFAKQLEATRQMNGKSLTGAVIGSQTSLDGEQGRAQKRRRKAKTFGAGSRIPNQQMTNIIRGDDEVMNDAHQDEHEDGVEADGHEIAFAQLRRQSLANGISSGEEDQQSNREATTESTSSWHTFKYRPILGMVAMSAPGEALEVALVERPLWDADLPARFYGDQEWDTK